MLKKVKDACTFCAEGCWQVNLGACGFLRRAGVQVLRFVTTTLKSFTEHRCGLHAGGLTYFTILGFVPVICMLIWRNTGWYFIISLSGLTTISDDLIDLIAGFGITARLNRRRGAFAIYLKSFDDVVRLLRCMGAER